MDIKLTPKHRKAAEEYLRKVASHEIQEMDFVLPYELSKKFRSLMLNEAATELISFSQDKSTDEMILTCIWQSIATTYGKICTKSKSGFSNIEEEWFKSVPSQLLVHRELMDNWRHKFIAHREDSEHERSIAFIKVKKYPNKPEEKTYEIKAMAKVMPTIKELKSFITLFGFLLKEVALKIDKEAGRVMEKFYAQGRDFLLYHLVDASHNPLLSS
jgi:hypothetical protein